MDRCPLCRATLSGADTCRRCRAELQSAQRVEREGQALAGSAMRLLALGDAEAAGRALRRAVFLHATPDATALRRLVRAIG
jgi:predicted amidophosphoribosyltransferase